MLKTPALVMIASLCCATVNLRSLHAQDVEAKGPTDLPFVDLGNCTEVFEASLWRQGVSREALQRGVLALTIVAADDDQLIGRLQTKRGEREIRGANCEDVAGALALVLAMSLREQTQASDPVEALVEAFEETPVVAEVPAIAPRQVSPARRLYAGLSVLASYGDLPKTEPGFGVHAALLMPSRRSFRLALTRESASTQSSPGARFELYIGQAELCPVALGRTLVLSACGLAEAGLLRAEGLEAMETNTSWRPWLALGGKLVARYAVNRRWFTEIGIGAVLPVQRDHFYFEPDASVHRVSALVGRGAFSMGVKIW